ncbi:MAG: diguanylate cyclase [Alphaproteobacteria bacterium]|uniref:diguanylate cyclase domain-containing protein n=1 Tax=Brevundimonas sp. TaxID=1871086 RepID=UPI001D57C836|nr:diguanylate cyclase [Alphaproteobacteria bacterium]MBU1520439.1 diguanylate cyclase [Alphaproteobacteria bacterium]MBU2030198.1 diguanylate cyclase [Alphaproteobacteria bacterium]MBU2164490.1 diguanylate cyclase [Alphaproteobacteria bacterium]MBU2232493.1 diguanylate cyclase [Alphaproteobacteria bacterium]
MAFDARVLILAAQDGRLGPLVAGLDALGWTTVTARDLTSAEAVLQDFPLDAAVVDFDSLTDDVVARLRSAAEPRSLPIMVVGAPRGSVMDADLAVTLPPHPAQAALRLEQMTRAAIAEEEFHLRRATFAARGIDLEAGGDERAPLRVLAAGVAERRFLALSNALTASGVEVVAAPTPYTAFDYLHESPFDAAVLWGAKDHAPALSIASGMKRNTRLYHIPLMLYLRDGNEIGLDELFNRGFADVATADTPEDETAERLLALAGSHRRHLTIRKALDSVRALAEMDASTGLFTPELFAAHLARVADASRARRRPLSVCVLRVKENEAVAGARQGGWLDRAMPQIGAMVSRLVRVEDTPARLAKEVFALALPATRGEAARLAAERIAAVIGCTAFDAGPDRSPFVAEFDVGAAEMQPNESAAALLERASADLFDRTR